MKLCHLKYQRHKLRHLNYQRHKLHHLKYQRHKLHHLKYQQHKLHHLKYQHDYHKTANPILIISFKALLYHLYHMLDRDESYRNASNPCNTKAATRC